MDPEATSVLIQSALQEGFLQCGSTCLVLGAAHGEELGLSNNQPTPGRIHFQGQKGLLYRGVPSKHGGFDYQLVVLASLVERFLTYFHRSPFRGHLKQMKTLLKILEVAWWSSVRTDIWSHVRSCHTCQQYRGSNTKPAGFLQTPEVSAPGEMFGVDFMVRNSVLMVVVDYCTKWVKLFSRQDAKTPKVCQILQSDVPTYLGSDRGPQFTSRCMGRDAETRHRLPSTDQPYGKGQPDSEDDDRLICRGPPSGLEPVVAGVPWDETSKVDWSDCSRGGRTWGYGQRQTGQVLQ